MAEKPTDVQAKVDQEIFTKEEKMSTDTKNSSTKSANSANISESSSSNGEEYEIIQISHSDDVKRKDNENYTETLESSQSALPSLNITGNGNQLELQKTLEECVEDNDSFASKQIDNSVPNKSENDCEINSNNMSLTNESTLVNEADNENHTVFHNIKYLGAAVINDPKNERLIHSLMKELNVIDDLCEDDQDEESDSANLASSDGGVGHEVIVRVPKSADGSVFVRIYNKNESDKNEEGGIVGDFPIYRIIFFARGNAGTTEESCFAFTVAIPVTPSLKLKPDASKQNHGKVTFKCHAFRCSQNDTVTKVFTSFAGAFKKPKAEGKRYEHRFMILELNRGYSQKKICAF